MKSPKLIALIFLTLLVGLVAISSCSRHDNRYQSDNHNLTTHMDRISQELDLNQGQLKKLEELVSNLEAKETAREKGHAIVDDIAKQLKAEKFDEKYVANTISNYLGEVEENSLDFVTKLSALHSSLTAEQKVKLARHLPTNEREHYHHHW